MKNKFCPILQTLMSPVRSSVTFDKTVAVEKGNKIMF